MVDPRKIFGRLGNSLFQYAFLYAYAKEHDVDFYFQNPAYFALYEDEIKKLFRGAVKEPVEMVAIHVRRGDNPLNSNEPRYSENPFYINLLKTDYYQRAMAEFPDADFLVFSDDIKFCRKHPIFKGCQFYHKSELEDLEMMIHCVGHIIANSSFSWWGAFLSPFTKKVIAPYDWFADGIKRTTLPDNWLQI